MAHSNSTSTRYWQFVVSRVFEAFDAASELRTRTWNEYRMNQREETAANE